MMNFFIHYLDKELIDIYTNGKHNKETIKKVVVSIKIAILLLDDNDSIYVPASNYYESELAREIDLLLKSIFRTFWMSIELYAMQIFS